MCRPRETTPDTSALAPNVTATIRSDVSAEANRDSRSAAKPHHATDVPRDPEGPLRHHVAPVERREAEPEQAAEEVPLPLRGVGDPEED